MADGSCPVTNERSWKDRSGTVPGSISLQESPRQLIRRCNTRGRFPWSSRGATSSGGRITNGWHRPPVTGSPQSFQGRSSFWAVAFGSAHLVLTHRSSFCPQRTQKGFAPQAVHLHRFIEDATLFLTVSTDITLSETSKCYALSSNLASCHLEVTLAIWQ